MCDLVDAVQVVVDLVRLDFAEYARPTHLCPDQVQQFGPLTTPAMLLTELLRTEPAPALDDRANESVIIA
mgnify:CR=1 FL=1